MIIIHIGLAGVGFIGKQHLDAYQKINNCKVTSIYSRSRKGHDHALDSFAGHITADFEELITNPAIDVIDICLPTFLHEEYIIKAANAKKHIICEKPITLTTESLERITDAIHKNNVQLHVGHVLRFWPEYQTIYNYHQKINPSDIEIVHAQRLGQFPKWSTWFQYPEKSGGALFDLHIHDIDYTYYLLGEVDTVYSTGIKNQLDAWVHVMTVLTFKNSSKAFIEASHRMPNAYPFSASYRTQTKDSTLEFVMKAGENIENRNSENHKVMFFSNQKVTPLHSGNNDAFYNELAYFIDCLSENKPNTIIPLSDVMYTLQLLEAIEESLQTNKIIQM